jgi:O-antigen/teichoic acid export membrane protein
MSTSRLIKNTGFLSFANALQPVISYFLIVAISKVWGREGLGEYSTIFAYIGVFQVVSAFGLKTLLPREVARNPQASRKLVLHGAAIVLPFAMLSMAVMSLWIILMGYPHSMTRAGVILSLSLLPASLIECFEGAIIGYQKIHWIAMIYLIENTLKVGVSLVLVRLGYGLEAIVWVFIASKVLSFGIYLWVLRHVMPHSKEAGFDWSYYRRFIRKAFPFVLITFFVMMYWSIDKIMLSKLTDMSSNGIYNAAYKFFWLVMLVISGFVTSLFPILSEFFESDAMGFERICFKAIRYFVILSIPCVLGLFFLSRPIIALIYGAKYGEAVPVLNVLCWGLIPYGISEILGYSLIASNYQRIDLGINAAGLIIMAGLNLVFIRWLGYLGAAWAVLTSCCLYLTVQVPLVSGRSLKTLPKGFVSDMIKTALSSVLAVLAWLAIKPVHWAFGAAAGLSVFTVLTIWVFRIFNVEDKAMFLRILSKIWTRLHGSAGRKDT